MTEGKYRVVIRSNDGTYERIVAANRTIVEAERIESGALRNLDHDNFYVSVESDR